MNQQQLNDNKIFIISEPESKRKKDNKTFSNYNFTQSDTLALTDLHKKTLSFNNTIGYSKTNSNIIMHKRILSKDSYKNPIMNNNYILLPKLNNSNSKNVNKYDNLKENKANKHTVNYRNIGNNFKSNKDSQSPLSINNVEMKQTNTFENILKSPLKYKIKKDEIPCLKHKSQQPQGTIININHNINHNIHINVNNTHGKLILSPINFKNIKIIKQTNTPIDNTNSNTNQNSNANTNTNSYITFINNKSNNSVIQSNNKFISMSIMNNDESNPFSLRNSFITKKSAESMNTKITDTFASNLSSLKDQDTLLSYNLSEDEIEDSQRIWGKKSLFETTNKSQPKIIDKEAFRLFCIDLDKKLASIKPEIKS